MIRRTYPFLSVALAALVVSSGLAGQTTEGIDVLLSKARSLETRGRMDLAVQNWKQALLVDANQPEALAGLARDAKQRGDLDGLRGYLDRLRKIDPKLPAIAAIQNMHVLAPQEIKKLDEAGRLAAAHKPDQAMAIYRDVLGAMPPPGKYTDAYFETEAVSTGGRDKAISHLRALSSRDPENEMYRFWLARVLTYSPKTRPEGLRLLESIREPGAVEQTQTVWRQALIWEKDNAAVQASLEAYLRRYPDPELQAALAAQRERQARVAHDAGESQGFQALNQQDLATAEAQFEAILRRTPKDANALIGLGYVRLKQQRFDQALSFFSRAREIAPQRSDIAEGYDTSKFWLAVRRGDELQKSDPDAARAAFEEALSIHQDDISPVLAIGQILLRQGKLAEAGTRFEQVMNRSPENAEATAGLGYVRLNQKDFDAAEKLFERSRRLSPARPEIEEAYRTARFWALVQHGGAALEENRAAAAAAAYREALSLNSNAKEALLGLANATNRMGNSGEAMKAYEQATLVAPAEVSGWLGLIRAQIDTGKPAAAIETSRRAPASVRQDLEARPDYLSKIAMALYATGQIAAADETVRRVLDISARSDSEATLMARLEVAGMLMTKGQHDRAVPIYQEVVKQHPDSATAWQGLIGAYAGARDFSRGLAAVRAMPRSAFDIAANDAGFLDGVASVYAADGACAEAVGLLVRSLTLQQQTPTGVKEDTRLQLGNVWSRERNYDGARQTYGDIVRQNVQSADGWRGYLNTLHSMHDDQTAVAEAARMPANVKASLSSDPAFVTLLASSRSAIGDDDGAVDLLQQARGLYQSKQATVPLDVDVQLAWAMLASSTHQQDLESLMAGVRKRDDLSEKERESADDLWSIWNVRLADRAVLAHNDTAAVAILERARRDVPGNAKVRSSLAVLYMKEREYQRVLDLFKESGMEHADAGDYRMAAGAALAAHESIVADTFLWEGRQRWPNDPELWHMSAMNAVSKNQYDDTERYLTRTLETIRSGGGASADDEKAAAVVSPRPTSGLSEGARPIAAAGQGELGSGGACRTGMNPEPAQAVEVHGPNEVAANQTETTSQFAPSRVEDEIDAVRYRDAPSLSIGGPLTVRSGDPGINRLVAVDSAATASVTFDHAVRFGVTAHLVHLDSGVPDGQSGYRFGTLPRGAIFSQAPLTGYGAEAQISGQMFGVVAGISPKEFPIQNWTAGVRLGSIDGPIALIATRDSVKDSLLSYAGARDPGTGVVWGGLVSNSASVRFNHDSSGTGQYLSLGAALIEGQNVPNNWNIEGTAGAYWPVAKTDRGGLSIGLSATGMHYDKNLNFFSLGYGGYFSPQEYLLGSVPLAWRDRRGALTYELQASLGVQHIDEQPSPDDPALLVGPLLTSLAPQPQRSDTLTTGPNYNVALRLEYHAASHLYVTLFGSANNARNYASRTIGVMLKLPVEREPLSTLQLKTVPDWRGRP